MTDAKQRLNPRRRSKYGRTARVIKRNKLLSAKTEVIQGHHKGFRKSRYSAIFVAPYDGILSGFIIMRNLIGHANAVIQFESASNIEMPVRDKTNEFPETLVKGGETVRVFIKPIEEDATVDEVSVGLKFKEDKK